jgi:hypothetical protein
MKTLTLAKIYESQGYIKDALTIYEDILGEDPRNAEALEAVFRLRKNRSSFVGVNKKLKRYFVKMHKKEHFDKFERWLAVSWS